MAKTLLRCILTTVLAAMLLFALASCDNLGTYSETVSPYHHVYDADLPGQPEIYTLDIEEVHITGAAQIRNRMSRTAETSNATYYFFAEFTDEENRIWVENAEVIIHAARAHHGILATSWPVLNFTDGSRHMGTEDVALNVNDSSLIGATFQLISGHRLPAWLSAGLELYWLNRYGRDVLPGSFVIDKEFDVDNWIDEARGKDLPEFGDLWFIPGRITDEPTEDILHLAFAYVSHLRQNGTLEEVVNMHLENPFMNHQEIMATEHWVGFFGDAGNAEPYNHAIFYTFSTPIRNMLRASFVISTDKATYHFVPYNTTIDFDIIEQYVYEIDSAILYVADWFGYDLYPPLDVRITSHSNVWNAAGIARNIFSHAWNDTPMGFSIYNFPFDYYWSAVPVIAAHEAVHAMTRNAGELTNFPKAPIPGHDSSATHLEEGLCNFVMYSFLANSMGSNATRQILVDDDPMSHLMEEAYFNFAGRRLSDEGSPDILGFIHSLAILHFEVMMELNPNFLEETRFYGHRHHNRNLKFIFSTPQAASFVAYLLDIGTRDDFGAFYVDIEMAQEIYGKSLDELVHNWLVFLGSDFLIYESGVQK